MKTIHIIYTVLLTSTAQTINGQSGNAMDWELEKSSHGIEVYTRLTDASAIKEFKASATIQAPIDELVAALDDVERHPEWMAGIASADLLDPQTNVLHYDLKLPFPMKKRYVVMHNESAWNGNTYRMEMETADTVPDGVGNHIRIEYVKGYWEFIRVDDSTTEVIHQFLSDPGGSVPDWLVNMFIVQNPYKTLRNLKHRLE